MKHCRVNLWANGCVADVGKCLVTFTGCRLMKGEMVYVGLAGRGSVVSEHVLANRSNASLRAVVREAYMAQAAPLI